MYFIAVQTNVRRRNKGENIWMLDETGNSRRLWTRSLLFLSPILSPRIPFSLALFYSRTRPFMCFLFNKVSFIDTVQLSECRSVIYEYQDSFISPHMFFIPFFSSCFVYSVFYLYSFYKSHFFNSKGPKYIAPCRESNQYKLVDWLHNMTWIMNTINYLTMYRINTTLLCGMGWYQKRICLKAHASYLGSSTWEHALIWQSWVIFINNSSLEIQVFLISRLDFTREKLGVNIYWLHFMKTKAPKLWLSIFTSYK